MSTTRRRGGGGLAALGLALAGLAGCQTYIPTTGQTLPSPRYLEYPPQYIPQSPPFPLPREQAFLEAQWGAPVPGGGALVPLPPAVPPGLPPVPPPPGVP